MGVRTAALESVTSMPLDCDPPGAERPEGQGTVIPKASTTVLAATKLHIPALRSGHLHRATLVGVMIARAQSRVALGGPRRFRGRASSA